jgi:signal transduction histidine kinase
MLFMRRKTVPSSSTNKEAPEMRKFWIMAATGSGLGLAIVRALAERWGGTATIANRAGGGARVEVRLPAGSPGGSLPDAGLELDEALPGRG